MKLGLYIGEKETILPEFKIFTGNDNSFVFVMKNIEKNEQDKINSLLNSFKIKILFEGNNLFLDIGEKYYCFNLKSGLFPPNEFYLGFDFLDDNDKIIGKERNIFKVKCK